MCWNNLNQILQPLNFICIGPLSAILSKILNDKNEGKLDFSHLFRGCGNDHQICSTFYYGSVNVTKMESYDKHVYSKSFCPDPFVCSNYPPSPPFLFCPLLWCRRNGRFLFYRHRYIARNVFWLSPRRAADFAFFVPTTMSFMSLTWRRVSLLIWSRRDSPIFLCTHLVDW